MNSVSFIFPQQGDCLNCFDGEERGGELLITARLQAAPHREVTVNGIPAHWDGECYRCSVVLKHYRTMLTAQCGDAEETVTVFKLRDPVKKYRLSSDDNILFLKDLNEHPYASIFENPYLAVYKKAHDLYGACVHLNLFYEYGEEEMARFSAHKEPFNLSMMTDRYKEEWQQNAHWLKLSFHARKECPAAPYKNATFEEVSRDMEAVHREIRRFAGEEVLSAATTLHFGAANLAVTRALRAHGYRALAGYFEVQENGDTLVAYHYPADHVLHVGGRDFWKDCQEDLFFERIDRVLNYAKKPEENLAVLEEVAKDPHRGGFLAIMIHEQYFYSDYSNYRPRFAELVLESCRWCYEHGYRGALLSDVVAEGGVE